MSGTMSPVWQHPLPWLIHLFCGCPCKLDERQRLHNMPMAMCKQGLHKDQSEAFWSKTDYTTTEDSGIQRNGDRKESETDAIERQHSKSEVKPEPHCHTEEERRRWSRNWWETAHTLSSCCEYCCSQSARCILITNLKVLPPPCKL